ncbi:MAG: DUF4127 family protein [Spirulinaceae cyanobacterium RM2_2_10]|nr:DUF4127 family protein [Spirulinaceae cyanobacterium RM2_2_10]
MRKRSPSSLRESSISSPSPQDDSAARYGFTALERQQLTQAIARQRLQHRIHLYPGADEVGCTLLARAYSQHQGESPGLYPLYSSPHGAATIPLYEDRPLNISVPAHILAAGGQIAASPEQAAAILAVNTPGQVMQEAWDHPAQDITYTTHRNLRVFVARVASEVAVGRPVAIADVAFTNGGETELITMLDDAALWDDLLAYAGWNTCCNTLGTAIATTILGLGSGEAGAIATQKITRLLEDWAYQTIVRQEITQDYLPKIGASYYDFNGQETAVTTEIARRLKSHWQTTFQHSFHHWDVSLQVTSPWQRLFEIGLTIICQPVLPRVSTDL